MTAFMTKHLEAAIIDQVVAGQFAGTQYAFVAVPAGSGWQLGVAVANESGYCPIEGKAFTQEYEAKEWADELNKHIGLSADRAAWLIVSTMGGTPYTWRD